MSIQALLTSINDVTMAIIPLLGNLLISLLLILVILLISKGLQMLVTAICKSVLIDKGLNSLGFNQYLTKGEIKRTPSELIGDLAYWLVLFILITSVILVYGPANSKELLTVILGYSSSVFAAIFILALSIFLSVVISGIVIMIGNNVGLSNTKTLAKVAQYGIVVFGFLKALEIFGISSAIIVASFSVIVGAVGLAFAIAFGLGCKDIAGDFVVNLFKGK
jgi:hypothetical protein